MKRLLSRIFITVGAVAMAVGTLDPLEGSLLIVPGSGAVALGVLLGAYSPRAVSYWAASFLLILVGVGAMFAISSVGGFGGDSGRSMWWGLLLLPYPAGWFMALAGGVIALVRHFTRKAQAPSAGVIAPPSR